MNAIILCGIALTFLLLSVIPVKKISGMPLRMDNTSADDAKKEIKNRAVFYEVEDGRYKKSIR